MKYQAVIFDLFGTLVSNFTSQGYHDGLTKMATALSLSPDDFIQAWFATLRERNTGTDGNCISDINYVCHKLNALPSEKQVQLAVRARFEYIRYVMTPQPHAIETLQYLKEAGYKLGLLSNCSHEIPAVWPGSPLATLIDVAVFSCSVNMRKPDPRIYELTARRLGVLPQECLYVGDGGSQELSAALSVGMSPVLFRPDANSKEQHLMNREQWLGCTISSLKEVVTIVQ
jgi:putative hydrolase of the HAD superfamily